MKLRQPLNKILAKNLKRYIAHKLFTDKYGLLFGEFTTMPYPRMKVYKSMRQIDRDFNPHKLRVNIPRHMQGIQNHAIIFDDLIAGESSLFKG